MNDAASILVIILSVTLTIFLLFAVALIISLIGVAKQINILAKDLEKTTKTIQATANDIKQTTSNVAKVSSPVFMGKFIMNLINKFKK